MCSIWELLLCFICRIGLSIEAEITFLPKKAAILFFSLAFTAVLCSVILTNLSANNGKTSTKKSSFGYRIRELF